MPEPVFAPDDTHVSGRRLLAHLIDGVIQAVVILAVTASAGATGADALVLLAYAASIVFALAYYVVLERRDGTTPGKRAVDLIVVDAAGQVPGTGALVRRTLPLLLEWLYVFALIGMLSSRYRQRLGDRWGRTYVIDEDRYLELNPGKQMAGL